MIRKSITAIAAIVLATVCAFGQMTDSAVQEYVKKGMSSGKTIQQISSELLTRGVTTSQARHILQEFKSSSLSGKELTDPRQGRKDVSDTRRDRLDAEDEELENAKDERFLLREEPDTLKKSLKKRKDREKDKDLEEEEPEIKIYGHDIFGSKKLSFEPNANSATPRDYILGPSDEVIIDVWGVNEATIKQKITPEGNIIISQIGPVTLSGLTIDQAENKLRKVLSAKYSLSGSKAGSEMSLTLGKIRSIQVHVVGEVKTPGTYRLSSLSSVFNALHFAGGVTEIGSVRDIKVSRNGEIISTIDLYAMIFDGEKAGNIQLNDDDIIIVPPYSALVQTKGGFKRPMYYEILPDDNVGDIVKFTGGFLSGSFDKEVLVQHRSGTRGDVKSVSIDKFSEVMLEDGDIITAYANKQRTLYSNMVHLKGCVARPGSYELGGDIATVRQLIQHAGGPLEEAFLNRAQLVRELPDRRLEIKAIPLGAILDGAAEDIMLRANDELIISDKLKVEPKGDVEITGYVRNPGKYEFAEGTTVQDLILLAGGLEDGASLAKVDVARRLVDDRSLQSPDTLATIFSFSIENGLVVEGEPDFTLNPYDIVSVRKSPSFIEQQQVLISGEINFPGIYTLFTNNERISSLFQRAGGATKNAYIAGATLKRKITEDERNARMNLYNLVKKGGNSRDSTMVNKIKMDETYTIGIDLGKALSSPGGIDDLILIDGDELIIPSLINTVRIQGEVMYPNSVNFIPGKNVDYYIRQAGGYSNDAKRSKVYVIHMNGTITVGSNARICAGDEIVIPPRPERQKTSVGEWIGIGSAAASITTMIATIVNLMNR